jgi:RNA polymerase sigma-70 factor (ECF subfamily)
LLVAGSLNDPRLGATIGQAEASLAIEMRNRSVADDTRFTQFYTEYWPRLLVALAAVLPSAEDPADVAQEAFARAYQHWDQVSGLARPDGWLFVTAYREASSIRRRVRVRRRRLPLWSAQLSDSPAAEELSLAHLLVALPERQRAALLLHYHYGLPTSEIARSLHCTQGTVKSLLHRGRAALRVTIEEEASA